MRKFEYKTFTNYSSDEINWKRQVAFSSEKKDYYSHDDQKKQYEDLEKNFEIYLNLLGGEGWRLFEKKINMSPVLSSNSCELNFFVECNFSLLMFREV